MGVLFFDASALVKRYVTELGSEWVRQQTDVRTGNVLVVSALAGPEVVATLARGGRDQRQLAERSAHLNSVFRTEWADQFTILDVESSVITESMHLAATHDLRGADAVHLAAALRLQRHRRFTALDLFTFVSADREQLIAADREGLPVEDPNQYDESARTVPPGIKSAGSARSRRLHLG